MSTQARHVLCVTSVCMLTCIFVSGKDFKDSGTCHVFVGHSSEHSLCEVV